MSDSKILVDVDALECILEYMSDIERSLSLSEALAVIAIRAEEKARDYEYSGSQGLVPDIRMLPSWPTRSVRRWRAKMSNGIHKASIPCDCGCRSVLIWDLEQWGNEPRQVIIDFLVTYPEDRLRERLKVALRILRRRDPWMHSIVLQEEGIAQLRAAIDHA